MSNRRLLFANNANSVLAAPVSNVALTLSVSPGAGVLFPNPSITGQAFKLTLVDAATGLINEIVLVTAVAVDTFTIIRAQEGTTAKNWLAGDICANFNTAGTSDAFLQTNLNVVAIAGLTNLNITLNALQYGGGLITLAGVLTGNIDIQWPDNVTGTWQIQNNTTGAHTVSAKTVSGANRQVIAQDGNIYFVISNGSEVEPLGYFTSVGLSKIAEISDTSSSTTTYTATFPETPAEGDVIVFNPNNTNTGASTLNGIAIVNNRQQPLQAGQMTAASIWLMQLLGTHWFILTSLKATTAQVKTGTDLDSFVSPNSLYNAQGFSSVASSAAGQTVTFGGSITLTHGLGRTALWGLVILTNVNAENGYTTGQKLILPPFPMANGSNSYGIGLQIPDATTAVFTYGANGIYVMNPSNGGEAVLTAANWTATFLVWG